MIMKHLLKHINMYIRISILLFVLFSCVQNSKIDKHLNKLEDEYYYFTKNDWEVVKEQPYSYGTEYYLKRESEKKKESLKFSYGKDGYNIYNYVISIQMDSMLYVYRLDDLDTSYHYIMDFRDSAKNFVTGFYKYQYFEGQLSPMQLNYYFQNKDSLDQVKGDSLQDLPKLDIIPKNNENM